MTARRKPTGRRNATSCVKSPKPLTKRFLGHALPGVRPSELTGRVIVIEGADGSAARRRFDFWSIGLRPAATPPLRLV